MLTRTALCLLLFAWNPAIAAPDIVGRAVVIDGDTIAIRSERIRLSGIDAPESAQMCHDADGEPYRCGHSAALALDAFLSRSRPTKCTPVDRDRYGRIVADCWRADGTSVSNWMVLHGWAVDYTQYSGGAYADQQSAAQFEKAGIWSGTFVVPAQWRRGDRLAQQSETEATCTIAANRLLDFMLSDLPANATGQAVRRTMDRDGRAVFVANLANGLTDDQCAFLIVAPDSTVQAIAKTITGP